MAEEKPTQTFRDALLQPRQQQVYAQLRRSITLIVSAIRFMVTNRCTDKKYTSYCAELERAIDMSGVLSYSDERLEKLQYLDRKALIIKVYENIEIAFDTDKCSDLPSSDKILPFVDLHWPSKEAFINRINDAKWILESNERGFNSRLPDNYTTADTLQKRVSAYQHVISTLDKQSGDLLIALIESGEGISPAMYQWLRERKEFNRVHYNPEDYPENY